MAAAVLLTGCQLLLAPSQARATSVWTHTFSENAHGEDIAYAAATDSQGDVIVTGYSNTARHGGAMTTIKYDPSDKEPWVHTESLPNEYDDGERQSRWTHRAI